MPPRIDGPRKYLVRDPLLAAALMRGIPNLSELATRLDVSRSVLSRLANGRDPLSDSLEGSLRAVLGVKPAARVPWLTKR